MPVRFRILAVLLALSFINYAGGPHAATAYGVVNTGGNAAGFLAPVVGLLVDRAGWPMTLASGSLFALLGAALWLFIRVDRSRP